LAVVEQAADSTERYICTNPGTVTVLRLIAPRQA